VPKKKKKQKVSAAEKFLRSGRLNHICILMILAVFNRIA
jgi:hypothetical protein